MNFVMRKLFGAYVRRVQKTAAAYGGNFTWDFSQCLEPVNSIIGTDKITEDGICEMLSAKWIDEHAHEGSLANWIVGPDQRVDASKIRLLMQWFMIGDSMKPQQMVEAGHSRGGADVWSSRGDNQDMATRNFLLSRGVIRRGRVGAGSMAKGAKSDGAIKFALPRALIDNRGGTGSYRVIGVWGSIGGHCMACYTGLQDIAFFDPNFGEFWFSDKKKFVEWCARGFFPTSFYSYTLNGSYEVFDYALRA